MEFFTWLIISQNIIFNVQEQGMKFLSKKILVNIDADRHFDSFFSDIDVSTVFQV